MDVSATGIAMGEETNRFRLQIRPVAVDLELAVLNLVDRHHNDASLVLPHQLPESTLDNG